MKKIKQLAAVIAVSGMLTACSSTPMPQELEYKVVCFDKENPAPFERKLNELAGEGWTNNGPVAGEGSDVYGNTCTFFIFQRKKAGQ